MRDFFFENFTSVCFFPLINRLLNIGVLCGRRDQIDHRTTSKSRSFLNFLLMCMWFLLTLILLPYFIEIDNLSIYTSISFFGISIFLIDIIILYICIIIQPFIFHYSFKDLHHKFDEYYNIVSTIIYLYVCKIIQRFKLNLAITFSYVVHNNVFLIFFIK